MEERLNLPTRRLGVILPSSNTTVESEFIHALRGSIRKKLLSLHFARIQLEAVTLEELGQMERRTEEEALKLASAQVNLIVYACTSGSLFNGLGHDIALSQRIGLLTGASALTTATAVLEALRTLGVSSVSVGTPYLPEVDEAEKRFLEQNGLKVVTIKGMGLKHNGDIGRIKPSDVFRLAMGFRADSSQGIFLSCTNMPTLSVIERLERETGKPVVSSNSATLWAALKRLELPREDIAGLKIPGLLESSTELAL